MKAASSRWPLGVDLFVFNISVQALFDICFWQTYISPVMHLEGFQAINIFELFNKLKAYESIKNTYCSKHTNSLGFGCFPQRTVAG